MLTKRNANKNSLKMHQCESQHNYQITDLLRNQLN